MLRQSELLSATVLLVAACFANAAAPPTSTPITKLLGSPGGTVQKSPVPSADGNFHVTINVQVNLTKLNPLATKAALVCHGIVDDVQAMNSKAQSIAQSTYSSCTGTAASASNSVCPAAFDALLQAYPNAPVQTAPITISNGGYQGTQAVNFTFSPAQLTSYPAPVFVGMCRLQIGNDSGMLPAVLDTAGDIQMPSATNMHLVMNGQVNVVVFGGVQFASP